MSVSRVCSRQTWHRLFLAATDDVSDACSRQYMSASTVWRLLQQGTLPCVQGPTGRLPACSVHTPRNTAGITSCRYFHLSYSVSCELKRRMKLEKKAKEKVEKLATAEKAGPTSPRATDAKETEEEVDPTMALVKEEPASTSTQSVTEGKKKATTGSKQKKGVVLKNAKQGPLTNWTEHEVICSSLEVPDFAAKNVVKLLDEGCTIPFIARYRKEKTGEMAVQKLRDICSLLEDLRAVISKLESVRNVIESAGKMTPELDTALRSAKTMTEVEDLYAPYKPGVKTSLAERARVLGLGPAALHCLNGYSPFNVVDYASLIEPGKAILDEKSDSIYQETYGELSPYVPKGYDRAVRCLFTPPHFPAWDCALTGVDRVEKAREGITHIIADIIHRDTGTMETIHSLCKDRQIKLESKKSTSKVKREQKPGVKLESAAKYETYFDKQCSIHNIQSYQVLAMNRGEDHKILTVKVILPPSVDTQFKNYCWFRFAANKDPDRTKCLQQSIDLCFDRLVRPQMCRFVRSQLTKRAVSSSIEVFGNNLKNLLLTPPLRGSTILALDPGFSNGCKCSVISQTGQILQADVVYILEVRGRKQPSNIAYKEKCKLLRLVSDYRADVFAIGNGCGCRETEAYVSDLIKTECPKMKYCVVDESGASIYSASPAAQKEMPHLDISFRGAVSIGRRLLDPLAEFIKIDPKHIGIGQYQVFTIQMGILMIAIANDAKPKHDMPQTQLKSSLDCTIQECVSFVGVDINTCSECLLSRVAGLTATRAKNIIDYRDMNGKFICREQLIKVKGVGPKSYEQAAGFIRVHPTNIGTDSQPEGSTSTDNTEPEVPTADPSRAATSKVGSKRKLAATEKKSSAKKRKLEGFSPNPLDMTEIHPESYSTTHRLLKSIPVDIEQLGQLVFMKAVKQYIDKHSISRIAEDLTCGEPTAKLITDALAKPLSYDFRDGFQKPLFRSAARSLESLKRGDILTGVVRNVTHFGAFVDAGVGNDGLIHISKMNKCLNGKSNLSLGDKVEVRVLEVQPARGRLGLDLVQIL